MFMDSKIRKIGGVYPLGNETITDPVDARRAPACARGVASSGKTAQRATVWRGEHLDSRRHCAILIESHSLSAALGCETSEIWTHRNNGLLEHWIIISLNVCWIADRSFHRSAVSAAEVDKCCVCVCVEVCHSHLSLLAAVSRCVSQTGVLWCSSSTLPCVITVVLCCVSHPPVYLGSYLLPSCSVPLWVGPFGAGVTSVQPGFKVFL